MLVKRVKDLLVRYLYYQKSIYALSRASATSGLRLIDETNPQSWEFTGFSQNGEDGIIDYLIGRLKKSDRYFVEIGSSDGIENNTAWLALAKRFSGLMIEGSPTLSKRSDFFVSNQNLGVVSQNLFVSLATVDRILQLSYIKNPDLMSLDIDGNDYYIAKALLDKGFKPKIFVVEYNSTYGPDRAVTIEYKDDFYLYDAHQSGLYFGVSVAAWKKLFAQHGYQFLTVDKSGTNAFFVLPESFEPAFLGQISGSAYEDNYYHTRKFNSGWSGRIELIKEMKLVEI